MATSKQFTIPTVFKAIDKFSAPVQRMEKSVGRMAKSSEAKLERMSRRMRMVGNRMNNVGNNMMIAGTAIVAPMALATREAIRFDDQLKDVQKTTGFTDSEVQQFGKSVLDMSKNTRSSIDELLKIGVIGGQMSVAKNEMENFVKSADKFNVALGSDFGGGTEQAILSVAKISSLFKETRNMEIGEGMSRAGSIINDLGAKTKATTENMTDFVLRAGKIPEVLRPTIQETTALGAVLEQNGINSEVGSRGLSILLRRASTDISLFARQMGMTRKEASKLMAESPTEFLLKFTETFKSLEASQIGSTLKKFGIGAEGAIGVVSVLSQKQDEFNNVLGDANKAFRENTSLVDEANTKNSAMAGKLQMLKNQFRGLAIRLGQSLFPIINSILKSVTPLIERFANWVDKNQKLFATIVKIVAIVGSLSFVLGGLFKVVGLGLKAISGMKFAMVALTNPITGVIAVVGALTFGLYKLFGAKKEVKKIDELQNQVNLRAVGHMIDQRMAVQKMFRDLRRLTPESKEYNNVLKELNKIAPEIVDKYDLQYKSIQKLNSAENELMKTMMDRARAQAETELFAEKYKQAIEKMVQGQDIGGQLFSDVLQLQGRIMETQGIAPSEQLESRMRLSNELLGNEQINKYLGVPSDSLPKLDIPNGFVDTRKSDQNINLNLTVPEGFNIENMDFNPSSENGVKINITTTN